MGPRLVMATVIAGVACRGRLAVVPALQAVTRGRVALMAACSGSALAPEPLVEVEAKLFLNARQRERLTGQLQPIGRKHIRDTYYDTVDYALTRRDWWLRQRGEAWELKVPWRSMESAKPAVHTYEEVEELEGIRTRLAELGTWSDSSPGNEFAEHLAANGVVGFARICTERVSLQADGAVAAALGVRSICVDLDTVDFDPVFAEAGTSGLPATPFVLAEVEVMAAKEPGAVQAAEAAVQQFLASHGLQSSRAYGKLVEYLVRHRPKHLAALDAAGVVTREELELALQRRDARGGEPALDPQR